MNTYEHRRIKHKGLPEKWKDRETLQNLERFLQLNWDNRSIFYNDNQLNSKQSFIDFDLKEGIKTRNYIGTIFFDGEQLNIFPKVFKTDEDDDAEDLNLSDLVHNLVIWLGYCDRLNFPFVSMRSSFSSTNNLLELLITIYVHYIQTVFNRSKYFKYEDETNVLNTIRGKINYRDFISNRVSRNDLTHFECEYSNFLFDNKVNQIIKHTLKAIMRISNDSNNLNIIKKILLKLSDVSNNVFSPFDCDSIKLSKLNQPYIVIVSMSKMFLMNKSVSYTDGINNNFSFLFPAELLYEGFVGGYIKGILPPDAKVTYQSTQNYLTEVEVNGELIGNAFMLKEDMVIESKNTTFVLDTKYKSIDSLSNVYNNSKLGINDNDIKQMASYGLKRNAEKLALIYPLYRNEQLSNDKVIYNIKIDNVDGAIKKTYPIEIIKIPYVFGVNNEEMILLDNVLKKIFEG